MHPIKHIHGAALLTALFIMTLVAIVATAMTSRLQLDIYRTQMIVNQDKRFLASQAVTYWALGQLMNPDNNFTKILKEGTVANYPPSMQSLQKNVKITGGLYDLQAQFNLNNLKDSKAILTFINLLSKSLPKMNRAQSAQLGLALMNWVSNYDPSHGKDVYASYYLTQKPPYYPSHQLMQSKSELRLIKDVSAAVYLSLEPLFTVLPKSTPININTAPKEILMSLGNGLTEQKISALLEERATKEIVSPSDLNEIITKLDIPANQVTSKSTYFLSTAMVTSDNLSLIVYTLMQRTFKKNNKITVNILRLSFNGF
ncbi:MAG: type II secretion system minor pseudopilin GspK [Legionella sp.]|nr:type II secretion system minor pseudopilin GspK [Legionella sp.]